MFLIKRLKLLLKFLFQKNYLRANKGQINAVLDDLPVDGSGCFFDIGGNYGIFSFWAAFKMRKNGGSVHVFEPQSELNWSYEFIRKAFPKVVLYLNNVGLSNHEQSFYLIRKEVGHGGASIEMDRFDDDSDLRVKIQVIKLDDYVVKSNVSRIDAIKIDVEGHELSVVRGGLNSLERFKPKVLIEVDPSRDDFSEIVDDFGSLGYQGNLLLMGSKYELDMVSKVPDPKKGFNGLRDLVFTHKN